MLKALQRLRHSRGFGVHSPYAYRFVGSVINPLRGYAYYAEKDIEGTLTKEPMRYRLEAEARTLLRIAAFVNPKSAFLPASAHKCFSFVLRAVNRHIRITDSAAKIESVDLLATSGDDIALEKLCSFIFQPGKTLLIRNIPAEWIEPLFESMKEGVMFEGKTNCIFLSRPGIWKVRYLMKL